MGWIERLEDQGFKTTKGPGPNGTIAYYITDPEDGKQYILSYDEIDDLDKRGKLNPNGLREHDQK